MELTGPDLAGAPGLVVIRIAPPAVQTLTGVAVIGATATARPLANGIELKQQLGAGQITSRLTFPHDGVMRFEVIDWAGSTPQASALAIVATANEHVYGFGERCITFDQSGRTLQTLTFDDPGVKTAHAYKVAPWFVSTRGYGFHLDPAAESRSRYAHGRRALSSPISFPPSPSSWCMGRA
jgi:hypothetical protein